MLHRKLMGPWPLFLLTLLLPLTACGTTQVTSAPPTLPIELLNPCLNLQPPSENSQSQRAVASDLTRATPTQISCWSGANRFVQEYEARVAR